jgi:hypothetical protein
LRWIERASAALSGRLAAAVALQDRVPAILPRSIMDLGALSFDLSGDWRVLKDREKAIFIRVIINLAAASFGLCAFAHIHCCHRLRARGEIARDRWQHDLAQEFGVIPGRRDSGEPGIHRPASGI